MTKPIWWLSDSEIEEFIEKIPTKTLTEEQQERLREFRKYTVSWAKRHYKKFYNDKGNENSENAKKVFTLYFAPFE